MVNQYKTIIVGAGQAGLAMGYYLQKKGKDFLLIDSHSRVGDSWRFRYDSLKLFTPRAQSALPGMSILGNQEGFPTKEEIADYLEEYAGFFNLPICMNSKIKEVIKEDGMFHILTDSGNRLISENIVIATGSFQKPYIPTLGSTLPKDIMQIHSALYKNPSQLNEGLTLIVGGGNSGMQIAAELASNREVCISIGKRPKFLPYQVFTKSIFWWFDLFGILNLTVDSTLGKILKNNDPIIGREVKSLVKQKRIKLFPRTVGIKNQKVLFEDGYGVLPKNIIWATGFQPNYNWIKIAGVLDDEGFPIHKRGVTKEKGLYFIGLSWQYQSGSALLLGVGKDAEFLSGKLSE
ncbi:flavin-containing monooxygenase [Bacillus sp. FSL K6-3431]|uniref:flavin-containing monooxygenase n=1 Tax=Bacillus sp. FSL K6-3431 TaxID=2921500 RepID=UPI0030F6025D